MVYYYKLGKKVANILNQLCCSEDEIMRIKEYIKGHSKDLGESCGQGVICVYCIIRHLVSTIEELKK